MRWLLVGMVGTTLAGCHQAPSSSDRSGSVAADGSSATATIAFNYGYTVRLPSDRISEAQERLSQACEQLAPPRCRITGMSYHVDDAGLATASLDMAVAAPIARRFGRQGVTAASALGGTLAGAEITGTDTQPDASRGTRDAGNAADDIARIDAQLARGNLTPDERAELIRQRAGHEEARRDAATVIDQARQAVATTPVSFRYQPGTGIGPSARLSDAWQTALGSLVWTLWIALMALAVLGPPLLLIFVVILAWRRWIGRGFARLWRFGTPPAPAV